MADSPVGKVDEHLCLVVVVKYCYSIYVIPYSGKIWQALNLVKWRKKGCILILAKFKFGDLELYL